MRKLLLGILALLGLFIYIGSRGHTGSPGMPHTEASPPGSPTAKPRVEATTITPLPTVAASAVAPFAHPTPAPGLDVASAQKNLERAKEAALTALAVRSPEYAGLAKRLPLLRAQLDAARKTSDTTEKLMTSKDYNDARLRATALEQEAIAADAGLKSATAALAAAQAAEARLNAETHAAAVRLFNTMEEKRKLDAVYVARQVVRAGLKSPDSAKFPTAESGEYAVTKEADGRYRISGYVDAVNPFNVRLRERWVCVLELVDAGANWTCASLQIGDNRLK